VGGGRGEVACVQRLNLCLIFFFEKNTDWKEGGSLLETKFLSYGNKVLSGRLLLVLPQHIEQVDTSMDKKLAGRLQPAEIPVGMRFGTHKRLRGLE